MKKALIMLSALFVLVMTACNKEIKEDPSTAGGSGSPTTTASQSDLLKDSLYLYTKEIYLWQDVIPTYDVFHPRQFTGVTDLDAATAEMDAIRAYQPLDRFSFVTTNDVSAGLQTGA